MAKLRETFDLLVEVVSSMWNYGRREIRKKAPPRLVPKELDAL